LTCVSSGFSYRLPAQLWRARGLGGQRSLLLRVSRTHRV